MDLNIFFRFLNLVASYTMNNLFFLSKKLVFLSKK